MTDEQDVRAAFTRLVDSGPPLPSGAAAVATGRRTRRRRTAAVLTTAAAATVAVVVGATALPGPQQAAPVPSVVTGSPLPVPGLSPVRATEITQACADERVRRFDTEERAMIARALTGIRLHNWSRDDHGELALLIGPNAIMWCESDRPGGPLRAGGSYVDSEPLSPIPGPLVRDLMVEGPFPTAWASDDTGQREKLISGRVVGSATEVTLSGPNGSRTVPVRNGTYVVRFVAPVADFADGDRYAITARGRAGRLVGELPDGYSASCYRLPDGTRVSPYLKSVEGGDCPAAVRWP